jgi:hypothetical protein
MGAAIPTPLMAPLERLHVFTPLGIQFWDAALDVPITDDLDVRAYWAGTDYPAVRAVRSASGIYVLHGLPGLRSIEYPADDIGPAGSIPVPVVKQTYIITVEDLLRRFPPTVFGVDLPLDYRGLFLSGAVSSLQQARPRAFLFSAPTRPPLEGLALIRADCWDADNGRAAAFAVLRVQSGPDLWIGIADEKGSLLVTFPYPLLDRLSLGSPPGIGQGPAEESQWPVTIAARYQPSKFQFPMSYLPELGTKWTALPSLKSILEDQQEVLIVSRDLNPTTQAPTLNQNLTFRQPLILKTVIDDPAQDRQRLLLTGVGPLP